MSNLLKSDMDKGISGDDVDLSKRKNAFGTNTYPRKKGKSLWVRYLFSSFKIISFSSSTNSSWLIYRGFYGRLGKI